MTTLWIVHRDPRQRSALIRAAGSPEGALSGAPGDPVFGASPSPDVVLLGLAGDFEAELEFAHQTALRAPQARWILAPASGQVDRARALFDAIDAVLIGDSPDARSLRECIHGASAAAHESAPLALSRRPARDAIARRFARWFADVELPELLRALDPQLGDVPLLIRGEAGTGRGLLAHYVHLFGADPRSELVHVPCERGMTGAALRRALGEALGGAARRCTIWLEDVDALPRATQRVLARWIELGLPGDAASARVVRWIASSGDEIPGCASALDAALRDALAGLALRAPTLRERPARIAAFASATALAWCSARRQRARRFGEDALAALAEYPWPLNLR
ncbi:MAG TPA: hypothetical protein VEC18_00230, partial [Myxococcota bacterium]|nr:hypothetical protein [Myxococcota bacterium]